MTFQGTAAILTSRGHRLHQPSQEREYRKPPQSNMVMMADGTEVPQRKFDHLKQHGPQKLRGRYRGCYRALKDAIPKEQWEPIGAWIESRRPNAGDTNLENDLLTAVLLGYAAERLQQNTGCLFDEIVEKKSASMIFLSN